MGKAWKRRWLAAQVEAANNKVETMIETVNTIKASTNTTTTTTGTGTTGTTKAKTTKTKTRKTTKAKKDTTNAS